MRIFTLQQIFILVSFLLAISVSCSSGSENPVSNSVDPGITDGSSRTGQSQTYLWGYYTVFIDTEDWNAEAVAVRSAMFTVNVVLFLNSNQGSLSFQINDIITEADYIDVDIDVGLTHPFPGMPQYNGYDVRGVFMGDGSATMEYNGDLIYPVFGMDQYMLADPDGGNGAPDGYTRWFNYAEFSEGGMPLFQYTQGNMAHPEFSGTATLNPYKYFADGLGTDEDLWTWINDHAGQHGEFTSGATNDRNYYLRFPNEKDVVYGYAVIANWEGIEPENHPSNAPEAVACSVVDNSDVWFENESSFGGSLKLDVSLWDWDSAIASTGVMEDYTIFIDSTILNDAYQFETGDMTPVDGGEYYCTYQINITADTVSSLDGNEYWVIVACADEDYTNDFGTTNLADTDPVAAFFRYDLIVVGNEPNEWDLPICNDITMRMVNIPAGVVQLGSPDEEWHHDYNEEPYQEVQVSAFAIGKFEVTNEQFECFILAGGYDNHDYWVYDEGWDWKTWQDVTEPYYWSSGQYNSGISYPDYPVVGVAWFEADAFCRWLSASSGYSVRMAYEDEWERAAEGSSQQLFPWGDAGNNGYGDSEDWAKANTENDVFPDVWHYSAPVGSFPDGASPFGIMDMGGNAWEWLFSVATNQYDDPYVRHSFDFNENGFPLLRSGTFQYYGYYLRPAHRFSVYPAHRWFNIGFRVVVEP